MRSCFSNKKAKTLDTSEVKPKLGGNETLVHFKKVVKPTPEGHQLKVSKSSEGGGVTKPTFSSEGQLKVSKSSERVGGFISLDIQDQNGNVGGGLSSSFNDEIPDKNVKSKLGVHKLVTLQ